MPEFIYYRTYFAPYDVIRDPVMYRRTYIASYGRWIRWTFSFYDALETHLHITIYNNALILKKCTPPVVLDKKSALYCKEPLKNLSLRKIAVVFSLNMTRAYPARWCSVNVKQPCGEKGGVCWETGLAISAVSPHCLPSSLLDYLQKCSLLIYIPNEERNGRGGRHRSPFWRASLPRGSSAIC